jgi:hypothetical protein
VAARAEKHANTGKCKPLLPVSLARVCFSKMLYIRGAAHNLLGAKNEGIIKILRFDFIFETFDQKIRTMAKTDEV